MIDKVPDISPEIFLSTSHTKAVRSHRRRLKHKGLQRVEVHASAPDAKLIRRLARFLRADEEGAGRVRQQLRASMGGEDAPGLKALLAAAPLQGVRIKRSRERGGKIDL